MQSYNRFVNLLFVLRFLHFFDCDAVVAIKSLRVQSPASALISTYWTFSRCPRHMFCQQRSLSLNRNHGIRKIFLLHILIATSTDTDHAETFFAASKQGEFCDSCMAESNVNYMCLMMTILLSVPKTPELRYRSTLIKLYRR